MMSTLAKLSVRYEDLRIENFALIADDKVVKTLDYLDKRYRVHYFLRRSIATIFEFRGALTRLSSLDEYKTAEASSSSSNKESFQSVTDALTFFREHHKLLKNSRNAVGGHFLDEAADFATANFDPAAVGRLELTFHPMGKGGGAKLHFAGEVAATAFTKLLPGLKPLNEEVSEIIQVISQSYALLTNVMHNLIVLFLWDRFAD